MSGDDAGDVPDAAAAGGAAGHAAFSGLLQRLRSEGEAGLAYEDLRARLIRFFRLHVPGEADELADVALDRLARRIDDGTVVERVAPYALGIARMVLMEARTRHARRRRAETGAAAAMEDDDAELRADLERTESALAECLRRAGSEARTLMLRYYAADGGERIRARQDLARELGVSINALRNRALRLRDSLENCVRERLARPFVA